MGDKVTAKVQEIFENYQPKPLEENIAKALDEVIQKAEKRVK